MSETSIRHSEKALRSSVKSFEVDELYTELRYYGHRLIKDVVYNMFRRDETPLENFWENEGEFYRDYFLVWKVARALSREDFSRLVGEKIVPAALLLSEHERRRINDSQVFYRTCHCLYFFLESLPAYFDYEVVLIAAGYPCSSAA